MTRLEAIDMMARVSNHIMGIEWLAFGPEVSKLALADVARLRRWVAREHFDTVGRPHK